MRVCRLLLPRVVAPARPALVMHARRLVSNKEVTRGNFRCGWWGARACWSPTHPLTPPLPHPALAQSPPLRRVGASAPRRGRRCAMPSVLLRAASNGAHGKQSRAGRQSGARSPPPPTQRTLVGHTRARRYTHILTRTRALQLRRVFVCRAATPVLPPPARKPLTPAQSTLEAPKISKVCHAARVRSTGQPRRTPRPLHGICDRSPVADAPSERACAPSHAPSGGSASSHPCTKNLGADGWTMIQTRRGERALTSGRFRTGRGDDPNYCVRMPAFAGGAAAWHRRALRACARARAHARRTTAAPVRRATPRARERARWSGAQRAGACVG